MSQSFDVAINPAVNNPAADITKLTNAMLALQSCFSGASAPSSPAPYMLWADTTSGILKQRNAANNGWINQLSLTGGGVFPSGAHAPLLTGSITSGGTTYSVREGTYTIVGDLCFYWGRLGWTAHTGTGDINISVPVQANPYFNVIYGGVVNRSSGLAVSPGNIVRIGVSASSLVANLIQWPSGGGSDSFVPVDGAVSELDFFICYKI